MAIRFNQKFPRWWRPQFSLRGLFLIVTAVGVWLGVYVHRVRDRRAAVQAIRAVQATVMYDFQQSPPGSGNYDSDISSSLPLWLQTSLGEDFFHDVEWADFFVGHWRSDINDELSADTWAAIMPRLPALSRLKSLTLKGQHLTDDAASYIGDLKHLETLGIEDAVHLTDRSVARFGGLKRLTTLALWDARITDESLRAFGKLRLKHLVLTGSQLSDAGLAHLRGNTELETLYLGSDSLRVTDEGMESLAGLLNLQQIELNGADLTSKGMEHLKRFSKLRCADLSNNRRISDQGLACLANLVNLEELNLLNTNVTSKGLAHLKRLKKLRVLNLSDNPGVGDEGIACLSQLSGLEELLLHHTGISSQAVAHLMKLPKLTTLDLSENFGITEEAIPYLAGLQAVVELDLHYTRLSSKGDKTAASLAPLARLTRLQRLNLAGTGADTASIEPALSNRGCLVMASRAGQLLAPKLTIGTYYESLMGEVRRLEIYRDELVANREGEIEPVKEGTSNDLSFFSGPQLTSPATRGNVRRDSLSLFLKWAAPELLKTTLDRMIALAQIDTLDPQFIAARPLLEAFAARLPHPYDDRRAKDDHEALLDIAASNDAVRRLYVAAISLVFADGLTEHLDRLEQEKQSWALTDVELEEEVQASKYLPICLSVAGEQLRLKGASSSSTRAEAVRSVWLQTRPAAAGATAAGPPSLRRN